MCCVDMDDSPSEVKEEYNKWNSLYLPSIFWIIFWVLIGLRLCYII